MMQLSVLCYLKKNGKTLMLHRVKKPGDMHAGKWNGLGGKFVPGETPEECVLREVREECGLTVHNPILKGVLSFPNFREDETWYVFVFVATEFTGDLTESDEGDLQWVEDDMVSDLPLWEGDRIFMPWLSQDQFFSGKFVYRAGRLQEHRVNFY